MGGLLFHPEFYKVAVAFAGCHDNRMDKIWWNEQWMGELEVMTVDDGEVVVELEVDAPELDSVQVLADLLRKLLTGQRGLSDLLGGATAKVRLLGPTGTQFAQIDADLPGAKDLVDKLELVIDRLQQNGIRARNGRQRGERRESMMYLEVDRDDARGRREIVADLHRVLADVRAAVTDWRSMQARMRSPSSPDAMR